MKPFHVVRWNDLGKWDQRFIEMANFVSTWSKDPKKKVGAVIVGTNHRDITVGYNGPPPGVHDGQILARPDKNRFILHAERNALDNASFDLQNATLYTTTPLCCNCAGSALAKGIGRLVCPVINSSSRWAEDQGAAFDHLLWGQIEIVFYQTS